MNCEQVLELLPLHVYGDLDAVDEADVIGHLDYCESCRNECEALRQVREHLDEVPPAQAAFSVPALVAKASAGKPHVDKGADRSPRRLIHPAWIGYLLLFAVLLPSTTVVVEASTAMCAETFFDPLPSYWHGLLVAFVPAANLLVLLGVLNRWDKHRGAMALTNGLAIGISAAYSVVFLPLMPLAVFAIAALGMGLLPLAPICSFVGALVLWRSLRKSSPGVQASRVPYMLLGAGAGVSLLVAAEIPMVITDTGVEMAMSEDPGQRREGISLLRRLGDEEDLLRIAYGDARNAIHLTSVMTDPPSAEDARRVYYRLTGQPFNSVPPPQKLRDRAGSRLFSDQDFDPDLGGDAVAGRVRGLSLAGSRLDAVIDPTAATAYVEWTQIFENDNQVEQEARAQIALPPGGVVSRLTLWVNGEPREAAFAGTSDVRAAYQEVAVVRRQDPVLVTWHGPDRVLMQCFPVPARGGRMKIRVGITVPLILEDAGSAVLRLPCFAERNFNILQRDVHAVWIESPTPLTCALTDLVAEQSANAPCTLRGDISNSELIAGQSSIRVIRSNGAVSTWGQDPQSPEHMIVQQIQPTEVNPTLPIVVVIDGSMGMADALPEIAAALWSLPPSALVKVVVAAEVPRIVDRRDAQSFSVWESQLRQAGEPGGCDNVPALIEAWESADTAAIVWIHAPQPVLLSEVDPLIQRLERRPGRHVIYDVEIGAGPNCVLDEMKNLTAVRRVPRINSLRADLERLLTRLTAGGTEFRVQRERTAMNPETMASMPQAGEHLARLWAAETIDDAIPAASAQKRAELVKMAAAYQLVTRCSGAVVLENQDQYDEAGLQPVDPATVPTIPEPEIWLLLVVVGFVLIGATVRRRR